MKPIFFPNACSSAKASADFPALVWDTSDIEDEVLYRLFEKYQRLTGRTNADSEEFQRWITETQRESVRREIWEDQDYWNIEWETMLDCLQKILEKYNHHGNTWCIEGENLGWLHRSGYKYVDCERQKQVCYTHQCPQCKEYQVYQGRCYTSGCKTLVNPLPQPYTKSFHYQDAGVFLREILPKTDCHFRIYEIETGLKIVNYHHDAPTGEVYYCTPGLEEERDDEAYTLA